MFEDRLTHTLDGLHLAEPITEGALTVFPLIGADKAGPNYLTLDEALNAKLAEVSEVSSEGRVPELLFENKGDDPILLVDGEALVGAKQNRVLNLTILVRPRTRIVIPVSCVERGRWSSSGQKPGFASADHTMFAAAKASKVSQVSQSLHATGKRTSDQSKVWQDIEEKLAARPAAAAAAPTRAMHAAYAESRSHLEPMVAALRPQPSQRGAVYVINGALAGVELFDKATTYAKLAAKLARSYALDAIDVEGVQRRADPMIVSLTLERLKSVKAEAYKGTDMGTDVRFDNAALKGAALVADEAVVHLEAFANT